MDIAVLREITENFTKEISDAASGQKTSLAFIKNNIPSSPLVNDKETFQAIAIGGTNFVSALVEKTAKGVRIKEVFYDQPPILESKDTLFAFIVSHLLPDISCLAINFAFPLMPVFENGRLDGIVIRPAKEHILEGLIGQKFCEALESYIKEATGRKIFCSVANDTICVTLSASVKDKEEAAGLVVGSGTNTAFFLDDHTLVNLESAGFDKFEQSITGKMIDERSIEPGIGILEKEVSGAYLYQHFNLLLNEKYIAYPPITATAELSELAQQTNSAVKDLAEDLLKYSAELISCNIAGIANFKKRDMTFVAQGRVFWRGYQYKELVEKTVRELTKHKVRIVRIEHADILGAAQLVA